jgi:hypothetical protein
VSEDYQGHASKDIFNAEETGLFLYGSAYTIIAVKGIETSNGKRENRSLLALPLEIKRIMRFAMYM